MSQDDIPTGPLRVPTLPLEVVASPPELYLPIPPHCPRCGRETEFLSAGHYQNGCLVTMTETGYHFCCPGQCELATT